MTREQTKWIRQYRGRLGQAWKAGLDDKRAARYAGCTEDELKRMLAQIPELQEYRSRKVDKLLIKAQKNIADKIMDGDVKVSEWYWKEIKKSESQSLLDEEEDLEADEDIDDFLDNCTAGKVKFGD